MTEAAGALLPTSVDVARRAGVSQSAVSLVFGGKAAGRVGPATQEAILRAARELAYRPNRAGRTLRSGRSRLVALAVPDVTNPYFVAVFEGAERAARARGYAVLLASVREARDWRPAVIDPLAARAVDGALLCTLQPPAAEDRLALRGRAVLVDGVSDALPSLRLDVEAGMRAAVGHLLRLGHTALAHLAADVDAETFHLRRRAYQEALLAAGQPGAAAHEERAPFTVDGARQAALRLLRGPQPPSALVCDSDVLAVGAYKAARDLGYAIPRDLSVASFDDSAIARLLDPELTTVAIPAGDIGDRALQLLLILLDGGAIPAPAMVTLDLIVRASTAPPGQRRGETSARGE